MVSYWKLATLCVIGLLLFGMGRLVGAACTTDCDDIEAYRPSNVAECLVYTRMLDPRKQNDKPTVVRQCSRRGTIKRTKSGDVVECTYDEDQIKDIVLYTCPLSLCDDLCPMTASSKEMDYNQDDDAMMDGEQLDLEQCSKKGWPNLTDKVCDIPSPTTGQ